MALDPPSVIRVAGGAVAGAALRWLIVDAGPAVGEFPWTTLVVNVAGCFVLGTVSRLDRRASLLWAVGFCGGLTTFASVIVEVASAVDEREASIGLGYLAASVVLGVAAVVAGRRLAPLGAMAGSR